MTPAALVVALALVLGLAVLPGSPQAKAEAKPDSNAVVAVARKETAVEAFAAAKAQKSNVEIVEERTGSSTTWATPEGFRTTEFHGVPFRAKRGGEFVEADQSLARAKASKKLVGSKAKSRFTKGAVLEQRVGLVPVRVSAGGAGSEDTPLAEVATSTGRSLALYWQDELPEPTVSGPEATFDVSRNVDLKVISLDSGFDAQVVLAKRPSGTPVYRFPMETTGITEIVQGEDGGYAALDSAGRALISIAPTVAWDSSPTRDPDDPDGGPIQVPLPSQLVTDEQGRTVLELRPNPAFLDSAVYPVTLDPQANVNLTGIRDTYVKEKFPNTGFSSDPTLRVGNTTAAGRQRAYLYFQTPSLFGTRVLSSNLRLRQVGAASCTVAPMNIYPASSYWASMTWNTGQPGVVGAPYATATQSFNNGTGSCVNAYVDLNVTTIVAGWLATAGGIQNEGFVLRGSPETGSNSYKEFCSFNFDAAHSSCTTSSRRPTLTVTYNTLPKAPVDQVAEPDADCVTSLGRPAVNTATPVLTGSAYDADDDSTRVRYEVLPLGGSSPVASGDSGAFLPPGSTHRWKVTSGVLTDGSVYKWRAKGEDATDVSSLWSLECEFLVDTTKPSAPSAASTDYPANLWSLAAGQDGVFALTPGADPAGPGGTASAIKGVNWGLDDPTPDTFIATTGAAMNVTAKPTTDGQHILYVQSVDNAGNTSAVTAHVFKVGKGAVTSPKPGDRTDRRFTLTGAAKDATAVTFQYTRGEAGAWADMPGGAAVPVLAGVTVPFVWDAVGTLAGDGAVKLRVVLVGGTADGQFSTPIDATVDQLASDAATESVGPGTLNLLTGEYTLNATDTSYLGISVARTARSRDPLSGDKIAGQAGPFGPQWSAGGIAEVASVDWTSLTRTADTAVQGTRTDGTLVQFTLTDEGSGADSVWEPEVGSEELGLTGDFASGFDLVTTDGTTIEFDPDSTTAGLFTLTSATPPGADNTTRYTYAAAGAGKVRLARIIAPTAAVSLNSCAGTGTPAVGCRVLELLYAGSTTASVGNPGSFAGRVEAVTMWATQPGTSTVSSVETSRYLYDETGRLVRQWDPRISPNLVTGYEYDADGRVTKLIPPGEEDFRFAYGDVGTDTNEGRLFTVTRDAIDDGKSATVWNVVYDIPLTGSGAPHAMDPATIATWGQTQAPTDATAIFPPDQNPSSAPSGGQSSYTRASVHYLDVEGRRVNTAIPGGAISTTEYDEFGNTIRELSFNNRERALRAATDQELISLGLSSRPSAERANLLSSASIYNGDGQRLLQTYGPVHQITLPDGSIALAREHMVNTYDQGRPTDGSSVVEDLVTTAETGARLLGADSDVDVRNTRTFYDWARGTPNKIVSDNGGLNITAQTEYDERARPVRTDMPSAVAATRINGADSTITDYYTAGGSAPCGGRPEWDGMVCRTRPAGAVAGGGANPPDRVTTTMTYDFLGRIATVADAGNGDIRTTTTTYDAAGRLDTVVVTGGIGQAVPSVKFIHSTTTGRVLETRDTAPDPDVVITRTYDALGRETSYTDADGGRTETTYTHLDQIATKRQFSNGATPLATSYSYSVDRQLLTQLVDPVAGTFTATHDPIGQVISQVMPAGVTMSQAEDPTGSWLTRRYAKSNGDVLLTETISKSVHGQTRTRARGDTGVRGSDQIYAYDQIGRLTQADDTTGAVCISRVYGFAVNTNRTSLTTRTGSAGSGCLGSGGTTVTSTYDTADRLTNAGYAYDNHGRTTAAPLPAGAASLAYFTTDMVRRQTIGNQRQTWALDPALRLRGWTTENETGGTWSPTGSKTNHYNSDSDSPAWVTENTAGAITRNVTGVVGDLAATTTANGGINLLLTTLHGDTGQALTLANPTTLDNTVAPLFHDTDEYGNPKPDTTAAGRYNWLGGRQRSVETIGKHLYLMGVRLYDPAAGRFLSVDPIPGGTANAYTYPADPVNFADLSGLNMVRGSSGVSWLYVLRQGNRWKVNVGFQLNSNFVATGWSQVWLVYWGRNKAGIKEDLNADAGRRFERNILLPADLQGPVSVMGFISSPGLAKWGWILWRPTYLYSGFLFDTKSR